MANVQIALDLVKNGYRVGLGSGHAAWRFIELLGKKLSDSFQIQGVPASEASAKLAREVGIPLIPLSEDSILDITVDGADEVDPNLDLIKGYGHALVREKVIAACCKQFIVLVGPENVEAKLVPQLGTRGKLPVEVIPFAVGFCRKEIIRLGLHPQLLMDGAKPFVSDNGNYILECETKPIERPRELEEALKKIPGIVGSGLFLNMADKVIIQRGDQIEVKTRK